MMSKKKMATYTYKISPASVKRAKKKGNKNIKGLMKKVTKKKPKK